MPALALSSYAYNLVPVINLHKDDDTITLSPATPQSAPNVIKLLTPVSADMVSRYNPNASITQG